MPLWGIGLDVSNDILLAGIEVKESGRSSPGYSINSDLKGEVTLKELLEFTKSSLIVIANQSLREEQSKGFDKSPIVVVDGNASKDVANVHPLGKIEFISKANMSAILLETYNSILGRSPVLFGVYKKSNLVLWNNKVVASDLASLNSWLLSNPKFNENDLIKFVNVQPYARKLERLGVTIDRMKTRTVSRKDRKSGKVRQRLLQPNGTYFLTARAIRAKYKFNSIIKFTFIAGGELGLAAKFKTSRRPSEKLRAYIYPAIVISVQQGGLS